MTASAAVLPIVAIIGRLNVGKSTYSIELSVRVGVVSMAGMTGISLYREGQWRSRFSGGYWWDYGG